MKKRITALLVGIFFIVPTAIGLAACNGGEDAEGTYEITVWVGEKTKELTERQIEAFNNSNEWGVKFNAHVEVCSESKAMGNAVTTPQSCADIFCVAQDTLARGVHSKLLATLNTASVDAIKENSDEIAIAAATIGDTIRAFPMTTDNGYFMYYDKRVVPEEDKGSLEALIADCEKAGKNFSMDLTGTGAGWYAAPFFYATGCKSEWTTDENGNFIDYVDTFDSDEGVIALKGMQKLMSSKAYHESAEVSDFTAGIPSAVVISGTWGYKTAQAALGEYLGIAPLPSFTVDGESYQLVTYLGCKLMCVKPQEDAYKLLYLQKLAMYLTSEECQTQRFEEVGWGPSNTKAAEKASSPALDVLASAKTTLQGQYPTNWWAKIQTMMGGAKDSSSDNATLKALLNTYSSALNDLKKDD